MAAPIIQGTALEYSFSPANDGTLTSVQVGELVLINVRWYSTGTISVLTVDGANATLLGSPQTGGPDNGRSQWATWVNSGSAGNKTVAVTITSGSGALRAWRVSGQDATNPVAVRNGASGTGTSVSVTLSSCPAECLGVAIGSSIGSDWSSPAAGWSLQTVPDAVWYDSGATAADLGSAGDKTFTATVSSGAWVVNAVAIQPTPPVGGGAAPKAAHMRRMMSR